MYAKEIKEVIKEYLTNDKAEYAIMIDGDWGSGKTYFLTHSLMEIMESIDYGKKQRRKYAYVSLYGIKSVDDISKEIVFHCLGKKHKSKVENADSILETASSILSASLGAVNIDLSKIKDALAKVDINKWIICFDDLERCSLPVNEILGFINRLVEHNHCKVIILANEKEIGALNLNNRLEEKYQVILNGKKLKTGDMNSNNHTKDILDIEQLRRETKQLFNEDILYKSIREKVVGLTVNYEPDMGEAYDSIIKDFNIIADFKMFLEDNKEKILGYFQSNDCKNIRTLIAVIGNLQTLYRKMVLYKYHTSKYYNQIMNEFLKYIIQFTIYLRKGGKVFDLKLTTEIGFVPLGNDLFSSTKGFKFLEKYCTTLSFSDEDFIKVVSLLKNEYEEEERKLEKMKVGLGKAYGELAYWWEKEDYEVIDLIKELKVEIKEDKYPFHSYQGIISQLLILEVTGFDIGNLDDIVSCMNTNIEKDDGEVDIEKFGHTFKNNPELRSKYDGFINKLKLQAGNKNQTIKENEISTILKTSEWAKGLLDYCDKHFNEFLTRYGFIDLINIDQLFEKIKNASTKEIYTIEDCFKEVYKAANINEFFTDDKEKIIELRRKLNEWVPDGINKPKALRTLKECLDDILKRLEKEIEYIRI